MRKFIDQSDVKHIMMSPIKTTMSVLKASTDIITNIPSRPIGLAEILAIMSVSTFKIVVILYLLDYAYLETNEDGVIVGTTSPGTKCEYLVLCFNHNFNV